LRSWRVFVMEQCKICKRLLNNADDPLSEDCGGDCLSCMATVAEDPDCIEAMNRITGPPNLIPTTTKPHFHRRGEPMRNVARLKMGYFPLPESEGVKLRSLLTYSQPASVIDPCVGQGTALHIVTSDAPVRRYGVELDTERARIASANGIETIQGNAFDAIARPESFSLLYLNPPYDSEIGSIANRRMEAVFLEHTYRWLAMEGVLILVIPFERLHDCAGILASHFTQLAVLRMTDEESVKYRQFAVVEADEECTPAARAACVRANHGKGFDPHSPAGRSLYP
jgi:hypothetical protein